MATDLPPRPSNAAVTDALAWAERQSRTRLFSENFEGNLRAEVLHLRARVAELEAERGESIGIEWGVRWPDGSDRVCEDRVGAESLALYRRAAGAHVVQRDIYSPGPWRVVSS